MNFAYIFNSRISAGPSTYSFFQSVVIQAYSPITDGQG